MTTTTTTVPDSTTYANLNELLQSGVGRVLLGEDDQKLETINAFLRDYPLHAKNNKQTADNMPWIDISARELFRQSIQTAIDIINDISQLVSDKPFISDVDYRRGLFNAVAQPSRRTYVGLWLIFLSFILYFIDSAT